MPEPSNQPPRHRERVQALRPFSASATGFTGLNAERDPLWIDRLRFHVPLIGIRHTVGDLYAYLQDRKNIQPFTFERTPAALHTIEFKGSKWLFNARLSFWQVRAGSTGTRGRAQRHAHPYRGHADITLNPTRLLAHMGAEVKTGAISTLSACDLRSWPERARVLSARTLDGSDNVIPEELIEAVIQLDWPSFCQAYARRVVDCISRAVGTVYDVGAEWEVGSSAAEALLDSSHLRQ